MEYCFVGFFCFFPPSSNLSAGTGVANEKSLPVPIWEKFSAYEAAKFSLDILNTPSTKKFGVLSFQTQVENAAKMHLSDDGWTSSDPLQTF